MGHARLFRRLIQGLDQPNALLALHLPHGLGCAQLAARLDQHIQQRFGAETRSIFWASRWGVIGRIWLQELGGAQRTRRFFSVGSPQQGTPLLR